MPLKNILKGLFPIVNTVLPQSNPCVSISLGLNQGVILKSGTKVWMYSSGMWIGDIISDKSIEYNQNEVALQLYADDVNYYTHTFKQPYPTYRGMDIDSIGWISN